MIEEHLEELFVRVTSSDEFAGVDHAIHDGFSEIEAETNHAT